MRNILSVLVVTAIASNASLQSCAQACFLSADFEDGAFPVGWSNTSVTVVGSGEATDAWTVGTVAEANANSYFPVLDMPIGNHFVMANDDAPPCDCAMDEVFLTTPVLDLTGRGNVALECRVFHEMTLDAGEALIESSTNGTDWTVLDTLDAVVGTWQNVFLDLSTFDGEPAFQIRFRWSDGGNWSSGFALDDVCFFERFTNDLSVVAVQFGDATVSPFTLGDQRLHYTMVPLEQAGPISVSITVANRGTTSAQHVTAQAQLLLGGVDQGTFLADSIGLLEPGEDGVIVVRTGWQPADVGGLLAQISVFADLAEDNPADNLGTATTVITGPGWEDGYGAMARDEGVVQGSIGSDLGFIAANRMEIVNEGSMARGASAVIGVDSQVGEEIRMILMDANFAFVDTSLRHVITQDDIDAAYGGTFIYLPFSTSPGLSLGDYMVGCQRLSGSGWVSVATSGNCVPGAMAFMEGIAFDIEWTIATPMVRLHLDDYGVGVNEPSSKASGAFAIQPNPANEQGRLVIDLPVASPVLLTMVDVTGREVLSQPLGVLSAGRSEHIVVTNSLPSGTYAVAISTSYGRNSLRLVVAH